MPGTSGLPLAGVEAIVEGLSAFQGDIRQMNSALDSIKPRQTLLQQGFSALTGGIVDFGKGILQWGVDTLGEFGRSILHIAEYALGQLLADAIQWVITKLKELASATIEAGSEFQTLELRLNGMNFDALIKSGEDFDTAQKESIRLTREQLEWLQKLAATTPYDNTDISNIYTLARSYGFTDDAARELTDSTVNFASSMGLSGEILERVIMNMGQMVQRGKITSTEMRDLARGAFVPLNDILERIGKKTGKSVADVMKEISKPGGGLPAQLFIDAFNEMVREEPRFQGAAERMSKTFKAASDNALDIVKSIGGLNVVKPVLDVIGDRISKFTESFTGTDRWDRMVAAATRVGDALANITKDLLGLLPGAETLADAAITGIDKLADWLIEHRSDISDFFKGAVSFIQEKVIPTIQRIFTTIQDAVAALIDSGFSIEFLEALGLSGHNQEIIDFVNGIKDALVRVFDWIKENGPLIKEFFGALGDIVTGFLDDLMGGQEGKPKSADILDSITKFMQYVIDNQDKILKWVEILWSVFAVWQVLSTIWNIAITIMIALAGVVLTVITVVTSVVAVFGLLASVISGPVLAAIGIFIAVLAAAVLAGKAFGDAIVKALYWIRDNITFIDWRALGMYIVQGIIGGINQFIPGLGDALIGGMMMIYARLKGFLGIHSPSTLFAELGRSIMDGMAQGVSEGVNAITGVFDHVASVINGKLDHMMSVAQEKVNHIASLLGGGGIDFGNIGAGISTAWAYGIDQGSKAAEKAGRNMAEKTTNSAKKKLRARSPSKLFEDLGIDTVLGFAQGIERSAGLAASAMRSAMGAAVVPAMSSVAVARASGNTYNNTRTANLTINSSAPTESIIQDFNMLESLIGT